MANVVHAALATMEMLNGHVAANLYKICFYINLLTWRYVLTPLCHPPSKSQVIQDCYEMQELEMKIEHETKRLHKQFEDKKKKKREHKTLNNKYSSVIWPGDRETLQEKVNLSLHMANIGLERSKDVVIWMESSLSNEEIESLCCEVEKVIQELKKYCKYYIRVVPKSVELSDSDYSKTLAENMGVFFLVIKENIAKDYTLKVHDEFFVRMIRIREFFDKFMKEVVYKCQRCCPNCCPIDVLFLICRQPWIFNISAS